MSIAAGAKVATLSDEELMDRVQNVDDREAFARLYKRYAQRAFRVARSVCANSSRAEEAVQEGFLSIWRGRARFDPGPVASSFGAWSMTIVRCAAIDAVRYDSADKRPKLSEEQSQPVDSRAPSPEDQAIARHDYDALRATLAELPEAQTEVIELAFFGELSNAEIAQQLDLPPGTVKGRMRLGWRSSARASTEKAKGRPTRSSTTSAPTMEENRGAVYPRVSHTPKEGCLGR